MKFDKKTIIIFVIIFVVLAGGRMYRNNVQGKKASTEWLQTYHQYLDATTETEKKRWQQRYSK